MRTVDSGPSDLFGDDEEDGVDSKRKIKRELGQEGFLDELDFEESFQDDEDKMEADDKEDDETKELEVRSDHTFAIYFSEFCLQERLKREYKTANKLREGYIDESEEEDDDETKLTLHGLQQHYVKLDEAGKNRKLNDLLDTLEFNQVTK